VRQNKTSSSPMFETYLLFRRRDRRFPGLNHRDIQHPQPFAFQAGLILKKSEQERALSGLRRRVPTIEVPQKGLAGCAGLRVFSERQMDQSGE